MSELEKLIFIPTEAQRKYKAALLVKTVDNPTVDLKSLTLQQAKSLVSNWQLDKWWPDPEFRSWLTNSDEWRQKLEFVLGESLEAILGVITDPDSSDQAKVRAFEVVARLAGREPARVKEVKYADAEVNKMGEAELDDFIAKHLKVVKPKAG